jgi:hypothetical protein
VTAVPSATRGDWLYGIAANDMSRHQRREQRAGRAMARTGAPPPDEGHADRVADRVTAAAARGELAGAMASLARGDREVVLLVAMDDLRMVRELFAERPPPSPEVAAAARARMLALRPARGARRRRVLLVTGVPLAAAAAVITALAAVGPAAPAPGVRPGVYRLPAGARAGASPAGSGRGVLLTAARTAGQASPAATGRYWVTRSEIGNFLRVGPPGHPYVILEKASDQDWSAQARFKPSPDLVQDLGVQFASPADAAAWRRLAGQLAGRPGQQPRAADRRHGRVQQPDRDRPGPARHLLLFPRPGAVLRGRRPAAVRGRAARPAR